MNVENQNPEHDPRPNKLGYNFLKLEKESATKRLLARAECRLFSVLGLVIAAKVLFYQYKKRQEIGLSDKCG